MRVGRILKFGLSWASAGALQILVGRKKSLSRNRFGDTGVELTCWEFLGSCGPMWLYVAAKLDFLCMLDSCSALTAVLAGIVHESAPTQIGTKKCHPYILKNKTYSLPQDPDNLQSTSKNVYSVWYCILEVFSPMAFGNYVSHVGSSLATCFWAYVGG